MYTVSVPKDECLCAFIDCDKLVFCGFDVVVARVILCFDIILTILGHFDEW